MKIAGSVVATGFLVKGLLALCLGFLFSVAYAKEVIDIPSKLGISTRTLYFGAPNSRATVLLFIGGNGQLRLTDDGQTRSGHTFVRSIEYWASHGINAVLVDSPFDLGSISRMYERSSEDHLTRVSEVIDFYQKKKDRAIWIFGHSMGTLTVEAFMNSGRKEVGLLAGYIVAGTVVGRSIETVVKLPALGIHHERDSCPVTPADASRAIIDSRPEGTVKELVLLTGGQERGNPCFAQSYHGFLGIEDEFIDSAAKFILQNSRLPE